MGFDLTIPVGDGVVNVRVGAIILKDGRFLMVKNPTAGYCYSVGGRIQFGESAETAILREVEEETGVRLEIDRLGFIHEAFFVGDGGAHLGKTFYEISFYFYMKTPEDFEPVRKSLTIGGFEESLVWVSPDDPIPFYPAFFRTELKRPVREIRHIVTDERRQTP